MAISLTTEGLKVDYRTTVQTSASGTYPIGTVIIASSKSFDNSITLPGTWASITPNFAKITNSIAGESGLIRIV